MEIDLTGKDISIGSRLNININGYDVPVVVVENTSNSCKGCALLGICHLVPCVAGEREDGKDVVYARTDAIKLGMKVFINRRVMPYSGGMVVVAANTPEEANKVLLDKFPNSVLMYDKYGNETGEEDECVYKSHWSYKYNNWRELHGVTAEYDVPTFLAEDGYSE